MRQLLVILVALLIATPAASAQRSDKSPGPRPARGDRRPSAGQRYSIAQAVSDRAQLHTIAFSGVAFLTGDFGAATFIPPGKVCDYFGFQYMRDIDAAGKGHNPLFLNRVAGNVLHILDAEQRRLFVELADEQAPQLERLARLRLPLIKAFHLERDRAAPGLSREAVVKHVGDIFELDAALSIRRAEVMAQVHASLDDQQQTYLDAMVFGDFDTWPEIDERDKPKVGRGKSKILNVAYMTYASEFFSWTRGGVEADTYFCPERHGTYFGGFYLKDMPAMGKRDHDISTSLTGDMGRSLLEEVLEPGQAQHIQVLPDLQRELLLETIDVRRTFSTELRALLEGGTPDRARLIALGRRYGELDGEMSWLYATAFAKVNRTLNEAQRAELVRLRDLPGYESATYYIYSRGQEDQPELGDVEGEFFE